MSPATRPPSSGASSCDLCQKPKLGACTAVRSQAGMPSYRMLPRRCLATKLLLKYK
uniref:Uncharacterized protein n=1 Tax=Arundo donax TaxID=35708 RepID=A0A0A9A0B0_ARUDO